MRSSTCRVTLCRCPGLCICRFLQFLATRTITAVPNGSGFTFNSNTYVGAVESGTAAGDAWWSGWTIEGSLD